MVSNVLSISTDEVTTINNQSWISIHYYVVEGWRWVPILLTLEQLVEGVGLLLIYKL
jgi:hypothetical protein